MPPAPVSANAGYKLVQVAEGVYSVHAHEYGETFHPVIGPVAEAQALYVKQLGLRERISNHKGDFVIWDVGLGAAANALTVLKATADLPCSIHLVSFDHTLEPLRFALTHTRELSYLAGHESHLQNLIRDYHLSYSDGLQNVRWDVFVADFPGLLTKPETAQIPKPHAIMFDAFSPATNTAMWTLPLFRNLFALLDPRRPCALPTYSRSTLLRVTLLLAGFFVGVGHATGEKEETTIAANDPELIAEPLDKRWLERVRRSTSAEPLCDSVYRQAPLSEQNWNLVRQHPQFQV